MMNHLRNRIKIAFGLYMMVLIIIFCPNLFAANHALLIGIQNYPDTEKFRKRGFQQLSGPRNDIKQMKKILLAQPFEFSKDNIKILLDKDATHTAIEKAFADLSNRIKPNDFVYIHFSGHGSQHENKNPKDDKEVTTSIQGRWTTNDQTWVTYGASSGLYPEMDKDDRDILDDEINVWLAEIGKITNRIVFVSDSCHSGSVSRGPKMGVRAIGMDTRPYPKEILAPNGSPKGIRIGASMDNESAVETIQGGQSYGRFTWFWSQALNDFGPGETWGNIFQRTKTLMREEDIAGRTRVFQEPQIMFHNGDEDLKVLEGNFEKRGTRISVTVVDEKNKLFILIRGF
ncbi:MAG: caspase family protein [Nitrosomonas sp.]|nr:caspase family protein [Nitrosomonas sp.]